MFLYQTWARPDMVSGAFVSNTDETTGVVTRTATPKTTFFNDLETMTEELRLAYAGAANLAGDVAGIAPVGEAFMRAVLDGVATRNFYAADALTDGKVDLYGIELRSPIDYASIYTEVSKNLKEARLPRDDVELTFHLSPGTPAMAAIWMISPASAPTM